MGDLICVSTWGFITNDRAGEHCHKGLSAVLSCLMHFTHVFHAVASLTKRGGVSADFNLLKLSLMPVRFREKHQIGHSNLITVLD